MSEETETVAEYIKRKAKYLHTWWGDGETNAPDWESDCQREGESNGKENSNCGL